MGKKILVATGGGDCPGLNAVIRGIVKRASQEPDWEVWGCMESFNGLLKEQIDIRRLTDNDVAGIHVMGGTIIKTTNRGGPFHFPVPASDFRALDLPVTDSRWQVGTVSPDLPASDAIHPSRNGLSLAGYFPLG